MKTTLLKLFEHKQLSREESRNLLINISENKYNESQIAAFITVYLMRAISVDELAGFREALLELCRPVDLEGVKAIDLCGTGGDGKNTFNISTLSSFVVAGAGYKVAKHGNYGVSSACGSSNVLEHLGYKFTNEVDHLKQQLDKYNICFLHAPLFHPAMKAVAPIRRQLGVKTFFNMLGPLVNPSRPAYQMTGVFSMELARLYQYILQQGKERFAVVHSLDGYDEISLTGAFRVKTREKEALYNPEELGVNKVKAEDLFGGDDVPSAAAIFKNVIHGEGTQAQTDAVCCNAGLAIHCIKPETRLIDCVAEARESLLSKKALNVLVGLTG